MGKSNKAETGLLSQSSWWVLNKAVTKELGFDASLLLSDLTAKQDYFQGIGKLDEDGFFFNLRKEIEADTTISEQRQIRALKELTDRKLVSVIKKQDTPPKLYYRVNHKNINKFIESLHSK